MERRYGIDFNTFLKNFKVHLSKLGLKNSIQKDYILKILFFSDEHLTVEEIAYKVKKDFNVDIGIATIYRCIKFFEELDIIKFLLVKEGVKKYELNLSLHHDHLVCTSCYKIVEFNDDLIELKQIRIAESKNFILEKHIMTIYGLCENCQ